MLSFSHCLIARLIANKSDLAILMIPHFSAFDSKSALFER